MNFLLYRSRPRMCDTSHVNERAEIERIKERIRQLMVEKDIKAKPLSKAAGKGETFIRDFFAADDLKIGNLHRVADALNVTISDIIGSGMVAVSGRIGAGGSVIFEEAEDGFAPRPPGITGEVEALEVSGDSMLPRYSSGDIVYIARDHEGILEADIGEYCAVRLATGETYVKQLSRGSRPGFFTLLSLNAEPIVDVELTWAAPIIFVLPRAARRRLGF